MKLFLGGAFNEVQATVLLYTVYQPFQTKAQPPWMKTKASEKNSLPLHADV